MNTQNIATQEDLIQLENNLIRLIENICDKIDLGCIVDKYRKDQEADQVRNRFIDALNDFLSSATELEDVLTERKEHSLQQQICGLKTKVLNLCAAF